MLQPDTLPMWRVAFDRTRRQLMPRNRLNFQE